MTTGLNVETEKRFVRPGDHHEEVEIPEDVGLDFAQIANITYLHVSKEPVELEFR